MIYDGGGIAGKKKRNHTPPCPSEELFFAESYGGHRGKDFGGRYGLAGLIGFWYLPPAWKVF